jgi:hypothetical protein
MVAEKGDIPDREEVEPESVELVSPSASAKVSMVDELLERGPVHVYVDSVNDEDEGASDIHLNVFDTHAFAEQGVIYTHGDDKDRWIFGDDIGVVEAHYEM